MDKLRKFIAWVWLNKERMVLVVMFGFLSYRVYEVIYPPEVKMGDPPIPPKRELPQDPEALSALKEVLPPTPPPKPPVDGPRDVTSLYRRNPLWVAGSPSGGGAGSGGADTEDTPDIDVLNIQKMGEDYKARLRAGSTPGKWYGKGDAIQDFVVQDIDPDAKTVTISSERLGQTFTLSQG